MSARIILACSVLFLGISSALATPSREQGVRDLKVDKLDKKARYGELVFKDGRKIRLTHTDILWAARLLDGEVGANHPVHAAAVLWTMVQRVAFYPEHGKKGLSTFFRNFSQPINPRWTKEGLFCRKGGEFSSHWMCRGDRPKDRAKLQATPWKLISEGSRLSALRFAHGLLDNPVPGSVNFIADCAKDGRAGHTLVARHGYRKEGLSHSKKCVRGNSFYAEHYKAKGKRISSANWDGSEVRIHGANGFISEVTQSGHGKPTLAIAAEVAVKGLGSINLKAPAGDCQEPTPQSK